MVDILVGEKVAYRCVLTFPQKKRDLLRQMQNICRRLSFEVNETSLMFLAQISKQVEVHKFLTFFTVATHHIPDSADLEATPCIWILNKPSALKTASEQRVYWVVKLGKPCLGRRLWSQLGRLLGPRGALMGL